jgi:hypothetical protein
MPIDELPELALTESSYQNLTLAAHKKLGWTHLLKGYVWGGIKFATIFSTGTAALASLAGVGVLAVNNPTVNELIKKHLIHPVKNALEGNIERTLALPLLTGLSIIGLSLYPSTAVFLSTVSPLRKRCRDAERTALFHRKKAINELKTIYNGIAAELKKMITNKELNVHDYDLIGKLESLETTLETEATPQDSEAILLELGKLILETA